ncbi:protein SLOW WALKER 1 [Selaginella moellendorffii]|uniref:protein SLOW WALKER 1 n=1 Tax=Selaginella moellendorffii TaxID=88036 RepID=UPI000D1C4AB0|nr:protein SLOW WALKER 1 [Selaginella moellendorffii]|eukprot:XP_024528919.1 protein SLOW WALKER 1 [Selaginella moellendorffii]
MEAASSYVPVGKKQLPKSRNPLTADSKFWRRFKRRIVDEQKFAVTCVDFCPVFPHDFVVTASTRVVVYDGASCQVKKTISRFTDLAYSGSFRPDGQLIMAGGETGLIQIFDANSRITLRQLKGHSRAVRWVRYSESDKLHVLSGSDDNSVRWWDVASEEAVVKFQEHTDYVRCGSYNPASPGIWVTGSYDHTVRMWDTRTAKSVSLLQHDKPLEDVLFFPSGSLLATAGGNMVKIWDVVAGKVLTVLGNHQKTVKKLKLTTPSESESRLLTASLDGLLKVFDIEDFKVVHAAKYPGPILAMDVSPSCTSLAVGTASGLLSVRQRKSVISEERATQALEVSGQEQKEVLRPSNFRYFLRGATEKASDDDYVLGSTKRALRQEHDWLLLKFRYKDALLAALNTKDPTVVVAVIEELVARKGLVQAFSNLEVGELEILLAFLTKHVASPKYSRLLVPAAHSVFDTCATSFAASQSLKQQVTKLKYAVEEEVRLQESLQSFQGMLQTLVQAAVH